jgi:uncharacterized protein YecE (DUF72 family)
MTGNGGTIRIGIGGWVFPPWRGTFYPKGLKQAEELNYASRHVTAIEINGTFYRTQAPTSFRKWRDETPDDFVFSMKAPRYLTHRGELASAEPFMEKFLTSGFTELGAKLGPILWQFAPFLQFNPDDFAAFLALLPPEIDGHRLRHVVEVRHASFRTAMFIDLAHKHNVAVAMVDDEKHPAFDELTADFAYLRLRRCQEDEATGYPPDALDTWKKKLQDWAAEGRDSFLYFINGAKVRAPHAAQALIERL